MIKSLVVIKKCNQLFLKKESKLLFIHSFHINWVAIVFFFYKE